MLLIERGATITLLTMALAASTGIASADPPDACVTAYEGAQRARKKGGLVRSKAELRLCLGVCPSELVTDCQRWLGEIDAQLARLSVVVRGSRGGPVAGGKLFIDGVERASGEAIELDPGGHELRVEAPGHATRTERVTVGAGTSSTRTIRIDPVDRAERATEARPSLLAPAVLGGAGLAALAAAAALAIVGHVDVADMRDDCAPDCSADRVERVQAFWTAGAVLAAAGGAAVIGASIWLGVRVSAGAPSQRGTAGDAAAVSLGGRF